jgi:hypothetical protein
MRCYKKWVAHDIGRRAWQVGIVSLSLDLVTEGGGLLHNEKLHKFFYQNDGIKEYEMHARERKK